MNPIGTGSRSPRPHIASGYTRVSSGEGSAHLRRGSIGLESAGSIVMGGHAENGDKKLMPTTHSVAACTKTPECTTSIVQRPDLCGIVMNMHANNVSMVAAS